MAEQNDIWAEGKPLEYPENTQDSVTEVDFPEITEFVRNMKLKGGIWGFQKEDVYEKLRQLNKLYQSRVQQMRAQTRGQLRQLKKSQQEELEQLKAELETEREELKAEREKGQQELQETLESERKDTRRGSRRSWLRRGSRFAGSCRLSRRKRQNSRSGS